MVYKPKYPNIQLGILCFYERGGDIEKIGTRLHSPRKVFSAILLKYGIVMNWDWIQLLCNWNKDEVRWLLLAHIGFNGICKLFHVEPAFDGWAWMSPARGHPSKREKGKVMATVNLAHIWKVKQGCILGVKKWISIFFLPTFQLHWP